MRSASQCWPGPACADRRVRRRSRHRRRKGSTHRHRRNRRGLNLIRINPTRTTSTRRQRRQHAHHGPAHHTERGRSHHPIIVKPNGAIIVIFSDAQHPARQCHSCRRRRHNRGTGDRTQSRFLADDPSCRRGWRIPRNGFGGVAMNPDGDCSSSEAFAGSRHRMLANSGP
jgi:hypothetical protein